MVGESTSERKGREDRKGQSGFAFLAVLAFSWVSAAGGETAAEARLVAAGGVLVDHALAGHPIDQGNGLLEGAFRSGQIVAVDGGADVAKRVAQTRAELAVLLAVLQTLTMRFERGCVRSHVVNILPNP
jgi:hypothetical protein